jgi:hypothetical protein
MRAEWVTAISLSVMLASGGVAAQWLNFKTPGVPRTPDGTPKLDSPCSIAHPCERTSSAMADSMANGYHAW